MSFNLRLNIIDADLISEIGLYNKYYNTYCHCRDTAAALTTTTTTYTPTARIATTIASTNTVPITTIARLHSVVWVLEEAIVAPPAVATCGLA